MTSEQASTTLAGPARAELDRVLTRLAGLGPARLSRPVPLRSGPAGAPAPEPSLPGGQAVPAPVSSPADLVRALLQPLADAAADVEGRRRRPVPVLADRAVGDQLALLVADALACADGPERRPAVLDDVTARLGALRRALP